MGYHIADIALKDGTVYRGVWVVGGIMRSIDGSSDIPFGNDDIEDIRFGAGR